MVVNKDKVCSRCVFLRRGRISREAKFTGENNMDPGVVPVELQGLTPVEEMLIAKIQPMMSVYCLPYGQYGYSGNVINVPQDVQQIPTKLPRSLEDDESMMLLRWYGESGTHKDFLVRRMRVRNALVWLKEHNDFYKDIEICDERLQTLPVRDVVQVKVMDVCNDGPDEDSSDSNVSSIEGNDAVEMPGEMPIAGTLFPISVPTRTERTQIEQRLGVLSSEQKEELVSWPELSVHFPINEYTTSGYIAQAFPALFPTGKGDMTCAAEKDGAIKVTPQEYFKHLLRYEDGRFARHNRFCFFASNSLLRWRAMSSGNFFLKQHPEEAPIDVNELREMSKVDKEKLINKIVRFGHHLSGTKQFWKGRRSELMSMIEQIGKLPTIFLTLSSADMLWPDLHENLFDHYGNKAEAVIENPYLCDWFFVERVKSLLQTVFKEDLKMTDYWGRFEFQHRGSIHFHGLAWLSDAPDVTNLANKSEEEQQRVVDYFDSLICTWNPGLDQDGNGVLPRIPTNPPVSHTSRLLIQMKITWDYCRTVKGTRIAEKDTV